MSTTIPGPYEYPIVPYHSGSLSSFEIDPIYVSDSGSLATLGSNTFVGTQTFTGDLVPTVSSSFSLGTANNPWKSIFISSGSLSLQSDVPGGPDAVISNKSGNLEVSVGGMQLLGNASFRAATGSIQYISGSTLNLNGNKQFNYGQFYSTITQSGSADTAYSMKFNVTDGYDGVSIVSGSRITAAYTGFYNLQFSAQLHQTTTGASDISIWIAKNGTPVDNSNTMLTIEKVSGGGKLVAAWNFGIQLNANQYVELMWSSNTANTRIEYLGTQTTPSRPATPSVIATVTQIA